MKKRKTFIGLAIFIAVLVLGIGYAAVTGVTLNINGNANVSANADFLVKFNKNGGTNEHTSITAHTITYTVNNENVTTVPTSKFKEVTYPVVQGAYTDDTNATMTVYLDSKYKKASATYQIINDSPELSATLKVNLTNFNETNSKNLTSSYTLTKDNTEVIETGNDNATIIKAGETVLLTVEVALTKLPVEDIENASYGLSIEATPQEVTLN